MDWTSLPGPKGLHRATNLSGHLSNDSDGAANGQDRAAQGWFRGTLSPVIGCMNCVCRDSCYVVDRNSIKILNKSGIRRHISMLSDIATTSGTSQTIVAPQ